MSDSLCNSSVCYPASLVSSQNPIADATLPNFATLSLSGVVVKCSPAKHAARWLAVLQAINHTNAPTFFYFRWKFLTNVRPESFLSKFFGSRSLVGFFGSRFYAIMAHELFALIVPRGIHHRRSFLPPYTTPGLSHRLSLYVLEMLLQVVSPVRVSI